MAPCCDLWSEIKIGTTVVKSFGYDGAGRRISATYGGVTTSYAYDYESRITSITRTGTTTNSFAYNGFDTRVSKTDSSGTTSYKRAGAYVTDSLLKSTVSSTTTDYTPGVSSRVSGTSTFDHAGLKNTDEQTGASGDITASRQYDAFGKVVSSHQTWTGPFGYGGPYGYQTDGDHGLMLLGHRYYESDTGRFLTRDPIKDGRNWYGYGNGEGNPITWADQDGLDPFVIPKDPGELLKRGWRLDRSHKDPNGSRYISPKGNQGFDYIRGAPGKEGYRGRLHVHLVEKDHRGKFVKNKSIGRGGHLLPGDVVDIERPRGTTTLPRPSPTLRLPLILILIALPSNLGSKQCVGMMHHPGTCPHCGVTIPPRKGRNGTQGSSQ